jgi:AraC-like DNA-binding protein
MTPPGLGARAEPARTGSSSHERHFYSTSKAIGRFGIRLFAPVAMDAPHRHGHIEANFLTGASMTYDVDGTEIEVGPDRLVMFWAGIPHQLMRVTPLGDGPVRLANIYLPVDSFLFMPHISRFQVALLGGAIVALPGSLCDSHRVEGWYRDYRSGDVERTEVLKVELNAMMRRAQLEPLEYLLAPVNDPGERRSLSSAHIRHVVAMVRFIVENLDRPIDNADVTAVTGLHQNYALSLFTQTMRLPVKRFVIRMRLLRARALLMESSMAVASVAEQSGFTSISQFYVHFKAAYGLTPQALRAGYRRMDLR